jgi:lipocalin-like protein
MNTARLIGTLVLLTSTSAWAAGNEELYGTWRLVSFTSQVTATAEKTDVFGKAPRGYLSYSRDGRMYAILVRDERPKPADLAKMTDQERAELFKTLIAYSGTFKFDGKTVTHHVDISWNENWTGTAQVRNVRLEGRTLYITTNPQPRSQDGKPAIGVLMWEKVE